MNRCTVCTAGEARSLVEDLAAKGATLDAIKKALRERGESLPTIALKRHLRDHAGIPYEKLHPSLFVGKGPRERQKEADENQARQKEVEAVVVAMVERDSVRMEDFLKTYGIQENPESFEGVVETDQAVTFGLFLKAAAVADKELELHMRDRDTYRYPAAQLKGLSQLHEMMTNAFALREVVSINAAVKRIHLEGGRTIFETDEDQKPETP